MDRNKKKIRKWIRKEKIGFTQECSRIMKSLIFDYFVLDI